MQVVGPRWTRSLLSVGFFFTSLTMTGQQFSSVAVPSNFALDFETAARLRPDLLAASNAASQHYPKAQAVFDQLLRQLPSDRNVRRQWLLRIVPDEQFNAFSSPDGGVYVESELAKLAGANVGLWAAILSHEIAHVVHRDWAQRYIYRTRLEEGGSSNIVLGDLALPQASWSDSEKVSADYARLCRQLEFEADRLGLFLMPRAGYRPDFVPALHHLLRAQSGAPRNSIYSMHPGREDRDRELSHDYVQASIEFEHLWKEWYASPGGNPPVLVFADQPSVKKIGSTGWQIRVPLRCQNLAGSVEVVLKDNATKSPKPRNEDQEISEITGCTSPKTTVTFTVGGASTGWSDVFVYDASGSVLARTDLPKSLR